MSRPLAIGLYEAAMSLFEPLAPALLRRRARRGKEDPGRLQERLGHASAPRPDGKLVWLHGVSVGESVSLLPLIARIRAERPDLAVLVTSGTVTSAELLAKRLPDGVIHQFVPIDGPKAVDRFLAHWRPDLGVFAESELWPNLILKARARGTRLVLVSARITHKTAENWKKRRAVASLLLGAFDLILPQDPASSRRLAELGAAPGPQLNLKYVADPLPADPAEAGRLRMTAAGRKLVFAASTHAGEERIISDACPRGPMLVIAVRHPDRGAAVAEELGARGRTVTRRGAGDPLSNKADVYVVDTLGELGLFFRLADVVIMGGSFLPGIGGHNPLEPARLSAGVVSGPHVHNFDDVYRDLAAAGGALMAEADALPAAVAELLSDSGMTRAMAKAAQAYAAAQRSDYEAGWALIEERLP